MATDAQVAAMPEAQRMETMAHNIFQTAINERRCRELLECLFDGGTATVDAVTRKLVVIPASAMAALNAEDEDSGAAAGATTPPAPDLTPDELARLAIERGGLVPAGWRKPPTPPSDSRQFQRPPSDDPGWVLMYQLAAGSSPAGTPQQEEDEQASVMPKVKGKPFRCDCGCNVFTRMEGSLYCCNACRAEYEGVRAGTRQEDDRAG